VLKCANHVWCWGFIEGFFSHGTNPRIRERWTDHLLLRMYTQGFTVMTEVLDEMGYLLIAYLLM